MEKRDIRSLIPQREPILMVDELLEVVGATAVTSFTVRADNCFLDSEGRMEEPGLVEHIAQSASAQAGYRAVVAGATEPPIGYIGEVKKFNCIRRPRVGETLTTTITLGAEAEGVTIITGETCVGEETVARTQMKIYVA